MKLETKLGLFPPEDREIEEAEEDGFIIFLFSPDSGEAEWVGDDKLRMEVAETVTHTTNLEMMIMLWD